MPDIIYYVASAFLVLMVLIGIYLMSKVEKAYFGNSLSAVSMALSIALTMIKYEVFGSDVKSALAVIIISLLIGAAIGAWITKKVKMIQMPQMVALLNGFGGGASALVGALTLFTGDKDAFSVSTAVLAIVVGVVTLIGSLIAAAKLQGIMKSKPVVLKGHSFLTALSLIGSLAVCVAVIFVSAYVPIAIIAFVLSFAFGLLFSIRVGGADMPITISLLNSFSGVAGAIAGLAIKDVLLVAIGGVVGASGLILTQIMCKAMNRSLFDILLGKTSSHGKKAEKPAEVKAPEIKEEEKEEVKETPEEEKEENSLSAILKNAKDVIFVPGYGMALAQAQALVKQLEDKLEKNGATVKYAIHPVAGRMPGHMNVLLAEVDVPYEKLYEMKDINDDFKNADVAIVIGANDVMNPAAKETENTPISGMPILNVADAKNIIICNYDLKPGYAGVENPLYSKEDGVTILLGDAKESLMKLISSMDESESATEKEEKPKESSTASLLKSAKEVIFVPGYGMALAQAQALVKQLEDKLEKNGATVKYAIHPVAGRMPGHMNVLLAEVDVPYEKLYEMKDINDDFKNADVAIVIGANDVMNPAAKETENTPISGMPILNVADAKNIIICNYDLKPGYAGVENPLYSKEDGVTILLGDAKESLMKLISSMDEETEAAPAEAKSDKPSIDDILKNAKDVIFVPGYGMALAQAQALVKQLEDKFEKNGATVKYAIHPVAGRMPGHMNVLLAEVDVPYEKLYEMKDINDDFKNADVAIVIGANDVMNPAAKETENTPISGMPILNVADAKNIIICNYDLKPGYAGVENPLYSKEDGVTILLGDAKESLMKLLGIFG
jgi:H+-translocating NAD(P) transhydrogenase subunit beta